VCVCLFGHGVRGILILTHSSTHPSTHTYNYTHTQTHSHTHTHPGGYEAYHWRLVFLLFETSACVIESKRQSTDWISSVHNKTPEQNKTGMIL
jgi:hypothetical protein